jgi:hypothetical protein
MTSQWHNFLKNLGMWRGSFTTINPDGEILRESPSLLTLEVGERDAHGEPTMVHFSLKRFASTDPTALPTSEHSQDYRSLGRQVVFFQTGCFSKGSMQLAPGTVFGGEFGFISGDRRHRLVYLYTEIGSRDQLVLIREWRIDGSGGSLFPLAPMQLTGLWQGTRSTISANWADLTTSPLEHRFEQSELATFHWLPDGGYCGWPDRVSHRAPFSVEAGWMSKPDQLERLIRTYDASGAWQSASYDVLLRA